MTRDEWIDPADTEASIREHVDRWATEVADLSATEWAELTGRAPSTVQRNVRRARR